MPALLRKSVLIAFLTDSMQDETGLVSRLLLPTEHFVIQGWPVPQYVPDSVARVATLPLSKFKNFSDHEVRVGAGNGMHVASVGNVLGFMLLTVRRKVP